MIQTQIDFLKSGAEDIAVGGMLRFLARPGPAGLGDDGVRAGFERGYDPAREQRALRAASAMRGDRCAESQPCKTVLEEQRSGSHRRRSIIADESPPAGTPDDRRGPAGERR